jgi:hypothetical protein
MAQNFLACDREQELLLPPSLREWLSDDHLAWFVIDAVTELELSALYAAYRADGHGRAAHEPAMMVPRLRGAAGPRPGAGCHLVGAVPAHALRSARAPSESRSIGMESEYQGRGG